jgi:hypothetical protein
MTEVLDIARKHAPLVPHDGGGSRSGLRSCVMRVRRNVCEGLRDETPEAALAAALLKVGWERVTRVYRNENVPERLLLAS